MGWFGPWGCAPQVLLPLFDFPLPAPEPPPLLPQYTHTSPSELMLTCLPVQEPSERAGPQLALDKRSSAGRDEASRCSHLQEESVEVGTGWANAASRLSGAGSHLSWLGARKDRLSGVVGVDSSPDGGRGEARNTCTLRGTEVCRATHRADSLIVGGC